MNFYVPPTLPQDFQNFLSVDIPGAVESFTILHDWYDQFNEDYEPHTERAQFYSDTTFSRYADVDNTGLNIRFGKSADIQKGDYCIANNGQIFLLDWDYAMSLNNKKTRPVRCNAYITITRRVQDEVDDMCMLIQQGGIKTIVDNIPVNAFFYDGRPQYSANNYTPGIVPNNLSIVWLQYNSQTKNIKIDDQFTWFDDTYHVISIKRTGMVIDGEHGVLTLDCKKVPGGTLE